MTKYFLYKLNNMKKVCGIKKIICEKIKKAVDNFFYFFALYFNKKTHIFYFLKILKNKF